MSMQQRVLGLLHGGHGLFRISTDAGVVCNLIKVVLDALKPMRMVQNTVAALELYRTIMCRAVRPITPAVHHAPRTTSTPACSLLDPSRHHLSVFSSCASRTTLSQNLPLGTAAHPWLDSTREAETSPSTLYA